MANHLPTLNIEQFRHSWASTIASPNEDATLAVACGQPVNTHDDMTLDGTESDYGSDLDDATLDLVFSQSSLDAVDVDGPVLPDRDDSETSHSTLRLARLHQDVERAITGLGQTSTQLAQIRDALDQAIGAAIDRDGPDRSRRQPSVEIEYDELNRSHFSAVQVDRLRDSGEDVPVAEEPDAKDSRSPIERFRTPPKKPLSVTDLISPAWCELQYWYSLTKYGRIKRTPAMKQGSKIHKQMEEQVHTEVPVQVATKEDKLGLRIWNVIQGLRTLRSTGLTRELEVFGTVEGELIIGIIDEISYNCPDEQLEAKILDDDGDGGGDGSRSKKTTKQDAHQHTLHSFLADSRAPVRPLYILDIKTRKSKTLPALGSRMRPTQMQLMLYRRLLDDLAANRVDADQVFARYGVDADASFSDVFIAALGAIDFQPRPRPRRLLELDDADDEVTAPSSSSPTVDPLDEILSHNTLASLWSYMIAEFAQTIPINEVSSALSPLLTAEFRNSDDGRVIGQRSFAFDAEVLDQYVSSEMRWWRGERETRGVEIEEAYKCGMCEFADGCTWRKSKVDEGVKKARLRNQTRARSRV